MLKELYRYYNGCMECNLDACNPSDNGDLVHLLYTKDVIYGNERWER